MKQLKEKQGIKCDCPVHIKCEHSRNHCSPLQEPREKKEKKLIQYEFIAQAENNPNGYFIIRYCDGRNCELKGFINP